MEVTKLTPQQPATLERISGVNVTEGRDNGRRSCLLLVGTILVLTIIVIIGLLLIISSTSGNTLPPNSTLLRVSTLDLADITAATQKLNTTITAELNAAKSSVAPLPEAVINIGRKLVPALAEPGSTATFALTLTSSNQALNTKIVLKGDASDLGMQGEGEIFSGINKDSAKFKYIYIKPDIYIQINQLVDDGSAQYKLLALALNKWLYLDTSKYGNLADKSNPITGSGIIVQPNLIQGNILINPVLSDVAASTSADLNCIQYNLDFAALGASVPSFGEPRVRVCSGSGGKTPLSLEIDGKYQETTTELTLSIEGITQNPSPLSPPTENLLPLNEIIALL